MPDTTKLRRFVTSPRADAALAAGLAVVALAYQATLGLDAGDWTVPIVILLCSCAIAGRSRHPRGAAVAVAAALLLGGATGQANTTAPAVLVFVAPLLVAYAVGVEVGVVTGLGYIALLAIGLQTGSAAFNPLFEMVTVGPWLAGLVVRSRRNLAGQIAIRNRELELARAAYAHEAVRYERARIARELHDIVAHCVTAIVVQAGAGRQLAETDPERAHQMLQAIVESADEAYAEIGLLGNGDRLRSLDTIEDLVQNAGAIGQTVRYQRSGDGRAVDSATSDAAFRIVQESLTNAVKHAAGTPVDIRVHTLLGHVDLHIVSGATGPDPTGLAMTGSGRGVAGMQRRAAECGGRLTAGPADGGWQVVAHLPGR
jgi:signal transduction histidine kinase